MCVVVLLSWFFFFFHLEKKKIGPVMFWWHRYVLVTRQSNLNPLRHKKIFSSSSIVTLFSGEVFVWLLIPHSGPFVKGYFLELFFLCVSLVVVVMGLFVSPSFLCFFFVVIKTGWAHFTFYDRCPFFSPRCGYWPPWPQFSKKKKKKKKRKNKRKKKEKIKKNKKEKKKNFSFGSK